MKYLLSAVGHIALGAGLVCAILQGQLELSIGIGVASAALTALHTVVTY